MTDKTFIDEVMGFDPAAAVTAFETTTEKRVNPNIYKTNPANSVSEDGHYHSKVRILLNPFNIKRNIIHQARYSMKDQKGFFQVISPLSDGDKNCPIFKAWKTLWFSKMADPSDPTNSLPDETKKAWARQKFDKSESDWCLVQIIDDENQPDLVGSVKVMKLPKAIMNRLLAKMNPTDAKKQKQPLMDYLFGSVLDMDVAPGPDDPAHPERKQREISYDLCDFDTDPCPIIKADGTQLFSDEEIEMIEEYNSANNDLVKAKTQAKKDEAQAKKDKLATQIRPLYAKAIEYIKTIAIDPVVECGYSPWTEEVTERVNAWIEKVVNMEDPEIGGMFTGTAKKAEPRGSEEPAYAPVSSDPLPENDELPF
jgi:hypothetical protein